jgi:hypothetical protein
MFTIKWDHMRKGTNYLFDPKVTRHIEGNFVDIVKIPSHEGILGKPVFYLLSKTTLFELKIEE